MTALFTTEHPAMVARCCVCRNLTGINGARADVTGSFACVRCANEREGGDEPAELEIRFEPVGGSQATP